jgi:hypothetical protein
VDLGGAGGGAICVHHVVHHGAQHRRLIRLADPAAPSRRTLWLLLAATVACYGTGYPLALWGHSDAGWVLVFLGGPLLVTLGVLTIRLIHRSDG